MTLRLMTKENTASGSLPSRTARDLEILGSALRVMATEMPARVTLRQCLFLMTVAYAHVTNRSVTVRSIRTFLGDNLGKSIEKSFHLFLEPTDRDPDRLGWITQVQDPNDLRNKELKLTKAGMDFLVPIIESVEGL